MISGLINYGLGHNSLPKQWQALYYFCGAVTIAWSVPIYFLMPTSPLDPGRFFTEREKEILKRRFQENPLCRDRQPFIWGQFKEAMLDWKTYLYLVMSSAIYVRAYLALGIGDDSANTGGVQGKASACSNS